MRQSFWAAFFSNLVRLVDLITMLLDTVKENAGRQCDLTLDWLSLWYRDWSVALARKSHLYLEEWCATRTNVEAWLLLT